MVDETARIAVAVAAGVIETEETFEQVFNTTRLLGKNAVPIPPSLGERFKEEYDAAKKVFKPFHDDWKEAYKAYNETGSVASYETNGYAEENFVRRVVQSLYEQTYMQDPTAEFTTHNPEFAEFAGDMKYIVEAMIKKAGNYGLNLRMYVQQQIIQAHLTNFGIIRLGNTPQAGSREDVIKVYNKVKDVLIARRADNPSEIAHMYELLNKLGNELQSRRPTGLFLRNTDPFMFLVDTKATKDDLSDTTMTFELEYVKEGYIQSEYLTYNTETSCWYFRYDGNVQYQTLGDSGTVTNKDRKVQLENDILATMSDEQKEATTKDAVLCVRVFDKVTRLECLYIHGKWDTPLWVWEDTMQLSRFFPYFLLAFSPAVNGMVRRSEASYYIPHQRTINRENQQWEIVRASSFTTIVYDAQNIDKQEVDNLIKEAMKPTKQLRAIGVKMRGPEGDLSKALAPFVLPIAQMGDLLNNQRSRMQIDSAIRLNVASRGQEFKTNTTNQAIEQYSQQQQAQIGAVVDQVESATQQLLWAISEVVVSAYPKDLVTRLVGQQRAATFKNMTVDEFNTDFALELEAGSTEKANSMNKKAESLQIIQMLGQFGTAAPITIITIVSNLLRKIFSRNLVTDQDLETLKQEGTAAMQKGVSTPQQ